MLIGTSLIVTFQASLAIPTPYAFNYHLDPQGNFRGLAFANFRASADADAVVAALNGFDVQGRKLRVEYKKVLQAGEKERIEREKALRRMRSMQLEKEQGGTPFDDFGPVGTPAYGGAPRPSFPSANVSGYGFPQQVAQSPPLVGSLPQQQSFLGSPQVFAPPPASPGTKSAAAAAAATELDLNDPSTLEIYSRILLFKDDRMRDELAFSRSLAPKERRVVHLIAKKLGLYHYSVGEGPERYAVVTRVDPEGRVSRHVRHHANESMLITPRSFFASRPRRTPRRARRNRRCTARRRRTCSARSPGRSARTPSRRCAARSRCLT